MNNIELENKIKEIIDMDNMFDMIMAAKAFESEYKTSDFYKATKMPMMEVIKSAKAFYLVNTKNLQSKFQSFIDNISVDNINSVFDTIANTFQRENAETMQMVAELKDFKDILTDK